MKVLIALLATVMVASAADNTYLPPNRGGGQGGFPAGNGGFPAGNGGYPAGNGGGGGGGYGGGPQADEASGPAKYEFSYEVQDPQSGNDFGHKESRDGDVAKGAYHVLLPDGRNQMVDYVADQGGYRPQVKYEGEAKYGPPAGPSAGPSAGPPRPAADTGAGGYRY